MRTGDAFPGTFLKCGDLRGNRITVTISSVEMEEVGDGKKPCVYFRGKDKALALNKTNASMIEEITGTDEMDDWKGHTIVLYPAKTEYQGRRVDCIRVDAPPTQAERPARAAARPVAAARPKPDAAEPDDDGVPPPDDDDIPF